MKKIIIFLLFIAINSEAAVLMNESWELPIPGYTQYDIGYDSRFRIGNNSCSWFGSNLSSPTCGNTCGEGGLSTDACCRSNDPNNPSLPWDGTRSPESILADWSTGRFQAGMSWTWRYGTPNSVHTVPEPVDGDWVARTYVPDVSGASPYRCNAPEYYPRPRALVGESSSSSNLNSSNLDRWYGVATWLDPAWDIDQQDQWLWMTLLDQHAPLNISANIGGVEIIFRKGYLDRHEWKVFMPAEFDNSTDANNYCGTTPIENNGTYWWCIDRSMPIIINDNNNWTPFLDDVDKGHWMYWVVHTKFDTTGNNNGRLEVWVKRYNEDWAKWVDYTGAMGPIRTTTPTYWKMGISDKTAGPGSGSVPKIIYFDAFKVGDENSNFNEVAPTVSVPPTCDSEHLELCINESECVLAGGYWCVSICQSSPCTDPQQSLALHGVYIKGGKIE